jgi:hypothetical protein
VWVIYRQPRDFPEHFVVAETIRSRSGDYPRPVGCLCETLDEAREQIPPGLTRMNRHDLDDPVIVEVWV